MPVAPLRVLLDSSALVDILRGRAEQIQRLDDLMRQGARCFVSAVNDAEIYAGMRSGEEEATESLFDLFTCIPLSRAAARMAGELVCSRKRIGRTHALDDMLVAATAIENDCMVWTKDLRDFEVPGVSLLPQE